MTPTHGRTPQSTQPGSRFAASRRGFLTVSGAGALSLMVGGRVAQASVAETAGVRSDAEGIGATRFAMITDPHTNVDEPERTDHLERVLAHIADRDPAFVLNCGDITDLGNPEEYELYTSCIPDALAESIYHVAGNHEEQWSTDAWQSYEAHFGAAYFSVDVGGLHIVGLDASRMRGWSRHFGADQLAWLEQDLQAVGTDTPIIVFGHYPVGNDWIYTYDDEDLLQVLQPYPVRGVFTGHTHTRAVSTLNGYTQVTGQSFKDGPFYYWAELTDGEDGPVFEVSEVEVPEDGEATEEFLTEIPLTVASAGGDLGPLHTDVRVSGEQALVRVEPPAGAPVSAVQIRVHPHQVEYNASGDEWTELTSAGRRQVGRLDISELPPGVHKVQVRAVDGDEGTFDTAAQFEIPGSPVTTAWTIEHQGSIRAHLARQDGLVVAATTTGDVEAYLPTLAGAGVQWRAQTGPVYRGPVITEQSQQLLVPSTDHHLHALAVETGEQQWVTDLGAPVLSEVTLAEVDGEERAFAVAGHQLFCLDPAGAVVWSSDIGGVSRGAAACDGEQVYIGSGDGLGYALDVHTGAVQWSRDLTERSTPYDQVLYGPWAGHVRLLTGGAVLFSTFGDLQALDAQTGELAWTSSADTLDSQVCYTPPTVTDYGILAFNGYDGTANLVDPATGEVTWDAPVLPESFGTAPVPTSDESVFWMVGKTGRLVRIDLAEESFTSVLQISWSFTESTPALVGSGPEQLLLVGGEDGRLHALTGLDQV